MPRFLFGPRPIVVAPAARVRHGRRMTAGPTPPTPMHTRRSAFVFCLSLLAWLCPVATRADAISDRMQRFVENGTVSGAVTLVATRSGIAHWEGIGKSDLAAGREMQKDDLFWIASMTKPMAAVCVLMLQEEGRLSIEDPVEKYLPEFKGQWVVEKKEAKRLVLAQPRRPITVRDLLTHTAGLGDVKTPRTHSTLGELAMAYAREPLQFEPGSRWSYSNPGINTLGRIVEVLSGRDFAAFIQERIFDPLQMRDTTFWPSDEQLKRVAKSYKLNKEIGTLEETTVYFTDGKLSDTKRTPYPAGGLYSSARDIAQFYRMMLNGGSLEGRQILRPETVELMTTTQSGDIKTGFVEGMSWGLGFQVVREPQGVTSVLSKGTFGHGGAYATQSWGDPVKGLVYVLLIQRAGMPNGDASEIRDEFQKVASELAPK
jgi:CubicO group peptidase (beta-lactamase class C family)